MPPSHPPPPAARSISSLGGAGVDAQVERLVGAAAAVEDALAGLMVDAAGAPHLLRVRAALAYVQRLYRPFLLCEPQVAHDSAGGGGDGQ